MFAAISYRIDDGSTVIETAMDESASFEMHHRADRRRDRVTIIRELDLDDEADFCPAALARLAALS